MTAPTSSDPIMDAIGEAVTAGRAGDTTAARAQLLSLWASIGVNGDPLHRCTLAHYLADLYDDPAQALAWDVRALDAADALTDQRVQEHHAGLRIAGFYPSLHLNLADNYRRLGSFAAARTQITAARECSSALAQDPYGDLIRTAIDEVDEAIAKHDSTPRASAPGPAA
ncbi:hypothetical protein [Amycolatopsis taiwanensis]|uniref:Tetratricopeptide repeat protein n=2 Tax=Amycolatopsis taiwanensis TaxID=342230 RepID=A0A9W6VIA9_9PSEU|nr:hypothetical protein [Amycolatopsis taiwanensis]GLY67311.1 hypothetical protein Atai01_39300 [Amycolatopsis taiwanensis]